MLGLAASVAAATLAAGCATQRPTASDAPPLFRLPPAALIDERNELQRLDLSAGGRHVTLDVLLQADSQAVRLAVLQMGGTVGRLSWDGERLEATQLPGWPAVASPERVLSDLQFVWWPAPALAQSLPQGWRLEDSGSMRTLLDGHGPVQRAQRVSDTEVHLKHMRQGYSIRILVRPMP